MNHSTPIYFTTIFYLNKQLPFTPSIPYQMYLPNK